MKSVCLLTKIEKQKRENTSRTKNVRDRYAHLAMSRSSVAKESEVAMAECHKSTHGSWIRYVYSAYCNIGEQSGRSAEIIGEQTRLFIPACSLVACTNCPVSLCALDVWHTLYVPTFQVSYIRQALFGIFEPPPSARSLWKPFRHSP